MMAITHTAIASLYHRLVPYSLGNHNQNASPTSMIIFEKASLSPDTWVNVWAIDEINRAEFYCCCQISELNDNDLDDYALEPVDANGIPIPSEKLQLNRESDVGRRHSEYGLLNKTRFPILTPDP